MKSGRVEDVVTRSKSTCRKKLKLCSGEAESGGKALPDRGWSVIRPENGLEWTRRPVWGDTVIPAGITYAEKICTGLPYSEITGDVLSDCEFMMMDEERIVGIKVCKLVVCADDKAEMCRLCVRIIDLRKTPWRFWSFDPTEPLQ